MSPDRSRPATEIPIADHAMVGDMRTVALVGMDGTVDWCCWPRFDSPSVFAALLDARAGGHYRIAPEEPLRSRQLYVPGANVLITRFTGPEGAVEVHDLMPVCTTGRQRLVRHVVGLRGEVAVGVDCRPRFDFGRACHVTRIEERGALFRAPGLSLALSSPAPLRRDAGGGVRGRLVMTPGATATFVLGEPEEGRVPAPPDHAAAAALVARTVAYWREWVVASTYDGRWRNVVERSALTLKMLTYAPTGAIVAAPTTSLPESIGGGRNWDYRYTWVRDSALTLDALIRIGFAEEAGAFAEFLLERFRASAQEGGDPLRILYRIDGGPLPPEEELAHLTGHRGSAPVRVGNAAADQLQLDIYGAIVDVAFLAERQGAPIPYEGWVSVARCADWVCDNWTRPDEGIWETRGGAQRFTHSRLMCWVALARAIAIALERSLPADLPRWTATRDTVFRWLMEDAWSTDRGAFTQHDRTDTLDAAVLLMPLHGVISPRDPRWLATLDAIAAALGSDGLVRRYDPADAPDGLAGGEGSFTICGLWMVEALAGAGRLDDARLAFERILAHANHVGLFAEEIGGDGEQLGNFPQAFTHLALIRAALALDAALDSETPPGPGFRPRGLARAA